MKFAFGALPAVATLIFFGAGLFIGLAHCGVPAVLIVALFVILIAAMASRCL